MQVGIMLVRGAILAVLVGILPVAAAASIQDAGWAWFRRLTAWIASFVLYKLVAAVYVSAAIAGAVDAGLKDQISYWEAQLDHLWVAAAGATAAGEVLMRSR